MIRYIAAVLWPLAALIMLAAPSRANVDGSVPGPGLCDYPGICTSGAAFGEYDYASFFPPEINGSQWTCLYGGAMFAGNAGVSFMFVNASITSPLGVLRGACWYACPGPMLESTSFPNPPGAWKNELHPAKCKPTGPAPIPITPPEGPSHESVTSPTGAPMPGPAPLPAALPILPNQTNPAAPAPFAPEGK